MFYRATVVNIDSNNNSVFGVHRCATLMKTWNAMEWIKEDVSA